MVFIQHNDKLTRYGTGTGIVINNIPVLLRIPVPIPVPVSVGPIYMTADDTNNTVHQVNGTYTADCYGIGTGSTV